MKVLNICVDDFANFSHDNAKALRSTGVMCVDLKLAAHEFGYESESEVVDHDAVLEAIPKADVIQIIHSDANALKLVKRAKKANQKLVVYHTGSRYRSRSGYYNNLFNREVDASIIALGEFANLGAKNEHYIVGAVDIKKYLKFGHEIKQPYKIAHFPSNAKVKGTEQILEMLVKVKGEFKLIHSTKIVNQKQQMKRIDACDIYIELFKPELNGKKYGSFGITALEAAAAGKIVITQNLSANVYEAAYGNCALLLAEDESNFISIIESLLEMEKEEISELQTHTYKWLKQNHSYKATGERIKKILNEL